MCACVRIYLHFRVYQSRVIKLSYARHEAPRIFSCEARKYSEASLRCTGWIISSVFPSVRILWHNFVYILQQNVGISSLQKSFISDLENPLRKTSEHNYKFCARLFERTIKASNLRFVAKCRH